MQVYAQKLPAEQKKSVYAPSGIKIDGKPTEWNNKFEAYDKATQLYYILSNDDGNLYLTIQATDAHTIEKALAGGVSFTIKEKNSKSEPLVITYPLVGDAMRSDIVRRINQMGDNKYNAAIVNSEFNVAAKEIAVKNFANIPDTLISVYNETGIKAAGGFDDQKSFTYELKIPFGVLGQKINIDEIAFEVKLSGVKVSGNRKVVTGVRMGSDAPPPNEGNTLDMYNATYFSGSYTMAKK